MALAPGFRLGPYENDWDWDGTEREFQRAIQLDPNDATAAHWYGAYLGARGRAGESLSMLKRAQHLDPLSLIISAAVGYELWLERLPDEAIAEFQKAFDLSGGNPYARGAMGHAFRELAKRRYVAPFETAVIHAGLGDKDRCLEWLAKLSTTAHGRCSG